MRARARVCVRARECVRACGGGGCYLLADGGAGDELLDEEGHAVVLDQVQPRLLVVHLRQYGRIRVR